MSEKNQQLAQAQALINAIASATSREAMQSAISDAKSAGEGIPGLSEAIKAAISSAEINITQANKVDLDRRVNPADQIPSEENLVSGILKPIEEKLDLGNKDSVVKLAEEAAKTTGKTDLSDGAFGETLRAIKAQEEKDKARLSSSSRLENLQEIAEKVKKGESVEGVDKKTLKAAEKVAKLDKGKIKKAREVRKARDNFDDLDYALSGVFDEAKPKPKALEDVPDASKPSVAEAEKKPLAEASQKEEKPLTLSSLFGGISDDDFEPVTKPSTVKPSASEQEQPKPEAQPKQPSTKQPEQQGAETKTNQGQSQETSQKTWVEKVQQPTEKERTRPDPNKMRAIWPPVEANMSPPPTPKKSFAPQQARRRNASSSQGIQ